MDATMSYLEVAGTLEDFLEGKGAAWDWDNYMSATFFADARLQAIQKRMIHLSDEFPADKGGGFCSPEGKEVIRHYIEELRREAPNKVSKSQ